MDILYLVDRLENLVASSKKMPLVNQIILKEAEILTIIDQMRTSIPGEVKQARKIIQDKERILAQAQSDATSLLARTREETERALSREGLLQIAEERSQEIIRRAQETAQTIVRQAEGQTEQLQNEADDYAMETLRNLREHLLKVTSEVEHTVLSIERGLDSLESQSNNNNNNNTISQQDTIRNPMLEDDNDQSDPPAINAPRRASLASDTMGAPFYPQ